MLDVAARLTAPRQRQAQIRQQHTTAMDWSPLARRRQRPRQPDAVLVTVQHEQPTPDTLFRFTSGILFRPAHCVPPQHTLPPVKRAASSIGGCE